MAQTADYFNRFYQTVIKDLINDPVVHSEWVYFQSMFRNIQPDKGRIELYLGILGKEHHRKGSVVSIQTKTNSVCSNQNKSVLTDSKGKDLPNMDLKLNQKYSEKWREKFDSFDKSAGQSVQLKKITSDQDGNYHRQNMHSQIKPLKQKREDPPYAIPISTSPNLHQYSCRQASKLKQKEEKKDRRQEKQLRLCQLSKKILNLFEGNVYLRG